MNPLTEQMVSKAKRFGNNLSVFDCSDIIEEAFSIYRFNFTYDQAMQQISTLMYQATGIKPNEQDLISGAQHLLMYEEFKEEATC